MIMREKFLCLYCFCQFVRISEWITICRNSKLTLKTKLEGLTFPVFFADVTVSENPFTRSSHTLVS